MNAPAADGIIEADALVVGLGFGGLYALHHLRNELGLKAVAIDKAGGVGGTWYWNKYPGALSDTEGFWYQYSFERELYEEHAWNTTFVRQPQILKYLESFADRHQLYEHMQFETGMESARFDEEARRWNVRTDRGTTYSVRFLVTGMGLLSAINKPDFPGVEEFEGRIVHTGAWPEDLDLAGKRVGIIGNGSTGNQVITAIAPEVAHLTSFQRTPQYSVPAANRTYSPEEVEQERAHYDEKWEEVWGSSLGFGLDETDRLTSSVSEEERDRIYEKAWREGGGFRFMFETFGDIATDPAANESAANFIRRKIAATVTDPETARKLTPTDLYARRPLCDSGYYETFNRPNVELVRIDETPISHLAEKGVVTSDGRLHELDVLVLATGFDAVDGNYKRADIRGREGILLKDAWADGPTSYLGVMTHGFPNMFMILGPNGPFTNLPPAIETQVRWLGRAVAHAAAEGDACLEVRQETEQAWTEECDEIASATLFPKAASWIFGANIPGKKKSVMFYLGGLQNFIRLSTEEADAGFPGFVLSVATPELSR